MHSLSIFDFNKDSDIRGWKVVDDVVMGGRSSGTFSLNSDGFGVFEGDVSLANNGGFSSIRYPFKKIDVVHFSAIVITLKGDGENYQFRIKTESDDYYSYIASFSTSGEWEEVEIPLKDMIPSFRGRILDQPNFSSDYMEEIGILIGNKKNQEFKLMLDKIELR
jgi:hypothetical protein